MTRALECVVLFTQTLLAGAIIIDVEPREDARGSFSRIYCGREFASQGLPTAVAQCSLSYNHRAGTLRGMHYLQPPAAECKLVRCTRGAIFDVIVDLRPGSPTFLNHITVELTADNRRALFVPACFAHGFQTLTDTAEVLYQMGEFHSPGHERGLRYDDPTLSIRWPLPISEISDKDRAWPLITDPRLMPLGEPVA